MRSVGMIAEFNPLHNGHVYALQMARQRAAADAVVVVLSGNYVQRGEPAIVDKWARTQLALQAGADVVVELPVHAVIQAGQQFAEGGLAVLAGLGVDALAFGTEDDQVDYMALAQQRQDAEKRVPRADSVFQDYSRPYASQLAALYADEVGQPMTAPNQMLALAYAEANRNLGTPLELYPIRRVGDAHDAQADNAVLTSGSAVRQAVFAGQSLQGAVPDATATMMATERHASWTALWPWLQYRLLSASLSELRTIDQMSEGLEYRFVDAVSGASDFDTFLQGVKSKRYTYARLRRLALATVLNMTHTDVVQGRANPFAHVLGFTSVGQQFLHDVKKSATLPIITKVGNDMLAPGGIMQLTHRVDSLYTVMNGRGQNFGHRPVMV